MRIRTSIIAAGALATLTTVACQQPPQPQLVSLQAPVKIAVVDGVVCLPSVERVDATVATTPLPRCEEGGQGFGLVVNQRSDKLGVVALGQARPRMVNLDSRRPGVTAIPVGRSPVDVAVVGDGTVAAVANQIDGSITFVDLWTLQPISEVSVEGTPQAVVAVTDEEGQRFAGVMTGGPNEFAFVAVPSCERPEDDQDRRDHDPEQTCTFDEGSAPAPLALPGRPVSVEFDDVSGLGFVIYRDLDGMSFVALRPEALEEDEVCLDGGEVPCEVARVEWGDEDTPAFGATSVKADPLGFFVYVLDRPKNRLLVVDRARRQLIDASMAMEPPLQPFSTNPGIPLVRSATAVAPEVTRIVLEEDSPGLVRYEIGARVAADNAQLYRVGVANLECRFEGSAAPSWESLVLDGAGRGELDEAACLFMPAFPLGGDPDFDDEEELLDRRIFDHEGALLAVNPVFGLRDGDLREGQFVGRAQCVHPEELVAQMEELVEGSLTCGTPLAPQPVARSVETTPSTFTDVDRADLMEFAEAILDGDPIAPMIERFPFDLRLVSEEWTVAYEGAIPGLGGNERGLVEATDGSRFLTGGANLCNAGVEVGDRLRILSAPVNESRCAEYQGEERVRTYEIVAVSPFEMSIAVIEEDGFAQELPVRECFNRGLRYEVRPREEWVVWGSQSGMGSPWEAEGTQCVLREGAESGRLSGRVRTGEEYFGPYLSLRIHEGEVDPVEGLSYTFRVERNFGLDAETISPSRQQSLVQSVLPAQVLFLPDLGAGRAVVVVDQGTDRIYVRNLATGQVDYVR